MKTAVAIYARISQDRASEGLGVQRQLKDCRAEAVRRGWTVADEYVDDDISAYTGKSRPNYRRMLDDLRDRRVDSVIVWHLDRLHRRQVKRRRLRRRGASALAPCPLFSPRLSDVLWEPQFVRSTCVIEHLGYQLGRYRPPNHIPDVSVDVYGHGGK